MDDAGVYKLADNLAIVQTLDFFPPVVDDPYIFGQIAATNAISDIYAMGGIPKTALNLVAFPDNELSLDILARILSGGQERIDAAGAVLMGGHTVRDVEIKYGLSVTGIVDPTQVTTNAGARPGDVLFLTKPLGTGFVTTANKKNSCPQACLDAACESMITLNDKAALAMRELGVRSATDITGFGLGGHGYEMGAGANVTIRLNVSALPLLPGAIDLCKKGFFTRASKTNREYAAAFTRSEANIDPVLVEFLFDAQTSGGLLLAVPKENADKAESVLKKHGTLVAARVGEVLPLEPGIHLLIAP